MPFMKWGLENCRKAITSLNNKEKQGMRDIYLISDTHFNHSNILKYEGNNRPFSSVEEMNEVMIDNWNSVVKDNDIVYHLGDVFFGSKDWFEVNFKRLKGRKRLVVGNHDDVRYLSSSYSNGEYFFQKIMMWRMFKEFGLLLTHVPVVMETDKSTHRKEMLNVHGHTHSNGSPKGGKHKSVCVELINFTPVNIEEIRIK